jgi:signal transduction histidine kinase
VIGKTEIVENGISKGMPKPVDWLLRKLTLGLPPLPSIGGRALATRVAAILLLAGAILIAVTVALPPGANGSDLLILGYGGAAAIAGIWLLFRRRVSEPALGAVAALGTIVVTLATLEGGPGRGTGDNELLFLWITLFVFWFFGLRHALFQLALIGVGDALFLGQQASDFAAGLTRWLVTMATMLVVGLIVAWVRRSLEREREETARLAVIAERMRIARDLHDAAGHGVTAISMQAAAGERALEEGEDPEEVRRVFEEIKRTSRAALEDMRKLLGVLRPGPTDPELERVSLFHLDQMIDECRAAGVSVSVQRSGEPMALSPMLDQTAYRIVQEALTNVLKHAGTGAAATVRLGFDPGSVELEITDDGPGTTGSVTLGTRSGLIGMRERVELFGGRFEAGPMDGGGFRVFARLPLGEPVESLTQAG